MGFSADYSVRYKRCLTRVDDGTSALGDLYYYTSKNILRAGSNIVVASRKPANYAKGKTSYLSMYVSSDFRCLPLNSEPCSLPEVHAWLCSLLYFLNSFVAWNIIMFLFFDCRYLIMEEYMVLEGCLLSSCFETSIIRWLTSRSMTKFPPCSSLPKESREGWT